MLGDFNYGDVEKWRTAFPGVDVEGELRKMSVWLDANPARRKKNFKRFAVNWLSKTHRDLQVVAVKDQLRRESGRAGEGSRHHYTDEQREESVRRREAENEQHVRNLAEKYPDLAREYSR